MKKCFAMLVAMLLVIQSFGMVTVFADWSGSGTEEDPYLITTAEEFAAMNNNSKGKYFKITQDLDFSAYDPWTPVYFQGCLDGGNHRIKNLIVNATAQIAGLFSEIHGEGVVVENLIIDSSSSITSTANNLGAFAGKLMRGAILRNCVNYANVTGNERIGGLIGQTEKWASTIENCINYGTVTGKNKVGGIIGDVSNSGSITISKCANYGTVVCTKNGAGIGGNITSATVTDCYNEGSAVYGIAGNGGSSTVSNCLVYGDFTSVSAGTVSNVYYCGTVTNENGATQVTAEQLADGSVTTLLNAGRTDAPWSQVDGAPSVNAPAEDEEPEVPAVTAAEITGSDATSVSFAVTLADEDATAKIIVAIYSGDYLMAVKTVSAADTSAAFETTEGATLAKIFVWEDLTTIKPIVMDEYEF